MKGFIALTVIGVVLLTSCQRKPAEQPAQEQPQQQQQAQAAGEQKQEQQPAKDMTALAQQKGCMACHDMKAKKVGPSYTDVAKKYAGRMDAVDYLAGKIKKGSVGEWGSVPMPPQNVTEQEAKDLAQWILSLK